MEIVEENTAKPMVDYAEDELKARLLESIEKDKLKTNLQKAAYLVDQALLERWMPVEILQHPNYQRARLCWSWYNKLFAIRCLAITTLTIIPFFQVPEWCQGSAKSPCGDPDKYLLSGVQYVRPSVVLAIEILSVLPLAVSLLLQRYYQFQTFWHHGSSFVKVGLTLCILLRSIGSVVYRPWVYLLYEGSMVTMYLNILTPIFFSRSLRSCFRMTLHIVHSFLDTAVLLAGFILLSAWLANVLFQNASFEDYPTSLLSLLIMLTTANNPNVWAETYDQNRASFFFFLVYMLVGFFFLMHLLFALIYNNYKVQLAVEVQTRATIRQNNLRAAYDLLNFERDGILVPTAKALFHEIGNYWHVHKVSSCVRKVFGRLHGDKDKIIFGDFQQLCEKFLGELVRRSGMKNLEDKDEVKLKRFSCTTVLVESAYLRYLSWAITFASLVAAILDRSIRGVDFAALSNINLRLLTDFEYAFGWFFFIEVMMSLRVKGSDNWNNLRNCYDTLLAFSIVGLEFAISWYPDAVQWLSLLIIIRSLRLVSLLHNVTRWRIMLRLLIRMVPATAPILGIQFFMCSLFAVVGVHLFGGRVYVGNPMLEGTEYAESGLWIYNYNDYASAMVTSFNLCIVNNWYVIMDGITAATGTLWARAYFITFWAIAVTFTLNVVVAFFVGSFTTQLDKAEHDQSVLIKSSKYAVLRRKKLQERIVIKPQPVDQY